MTTFSNPILSARKTRLIPIKNSRSVTSTTVVNSARARKPDAGKVTGVPDAKLAPVASGITNRNTLFSAFSNFKTDASNSNSTFTPTRGVVTPVAKISTAIFVPRPETLPEVTPLSIRLPAPPLAMRSSDRVALSLGPAEACPTNTSNTSKKKNKNPFLENISNIPMRNVRCAPLFDPV